MADEDDKKKKQEDANVEEKEQTSSKGGMLQWIIMAVIVIVCAGSGLFLGRLFAGSPPETIESPQEDAPAQTENPAPNDSTTEKDSKDVWYYPIGPVVANLNVPNVTRYVRATLTLEISTALEEKEGTKLLAKKMPVLTSWLYIYLSSLTLDDVTGDKNLRRIQSQILDAFNEELFPDAKPQIKKILFKEFPVQ